VVRPPASPPFNFASAGPFLIRSSGNKITVQPDDNYRCPLNCAYTAEMGVAERVAEMDYDPDYQPVTDGIARRNIMLNNARNEANDGMQAFDLIHDIPHRDPNAYQPLLEFCFAIPDKKRRGLQAAYWHLRLGRNVVGLREQFDRLSDDPMMAHRLALLCLEAALDDWPTPSPTIRTQRDRLRMALVQALATTGFIRFAEVANSHGRAGDQDVFPSTILGKATNSKPSG
jgi:asparagine synthase (glutamine-hydrolysing)